jgi:hypothetical protein
MVEGTPRCSTQFVAIDWVAKLAARWLLGR